MGATVIFDLDGTLADTSGDLIAAANVCFEGMGLGPMLQPGADAGTALHGARAMLRLGLSRAGHADPEAEIERQYPVLLEAYMADIDSHTQLLPGAMEAVEALRADGYIVGICTNKPDYMAELLLERLGIAGAFASMVGAGTLPVSKPDPAPLFEAVARAGGDRARACLVGDSVTDRDCARNAGVPSVLVGFGPGSAAGAGLEPDVLLDHYGQMLDAARHLLGPA